MTRTEKNIERTMKAIDHQMTELRDVYDEIIVDDDESIALAQQANDYLIKATNLFENLIAQKA